MGIGTAVRTRLGKWEVPAAELYRSAFINLDDLAEVLSPLAPVGRVLEIGCGDGLMAERLCAAFPAAEYVGLDVSAAPGRLFAGDRARAIFRSITSSEFRTTDPGSFDLVAVVDVLHHVAGNERSQLLQDAGALLAPRGVLALKEWERGPNLPHLMTFVSDRYVSGDSGVSFLSGPELRDLVSGALPDFTVTNRMRIPPRRNNVLVTLRRTEKPAGDS